MLFIVSEETVLPIVIQKMIVDLVKRELPKEAFVDFERFKRVIIIERFTGED